VLLVIHPVLEREPARGDAAFAALHEELAREARAAGLAVVDLREAYARHAPGELQQTAVDWFDPWHPNARGHAVAAEAIEAELRRAGLL
jgi:lysophospholipase L1-like esterase